MGGKVRGVYVTGGHVLQQHWHVAPGMPLAHARGWRLVHRRAEGELVDESVEYAGNAHGSPFTARAVTVGLYRP
jgi:hypothetical protein